MAYNFSLKKFANGTIQLTYYDFPILSAVDKQEKLFIDNDDFDSSPYTEPYLVDSFTPWGYEDGIIDLDYEFKNDSSFDEQLSDEELLERREKCIYSSLSRSVNKIYDLGRNNIWEWFFTFTLNESAVVDRFDYSECSKKICKWFNNIRSRKCPNIKYLIIPEKHPTSGAWHFHALVSNCDELNFTIATNNQEFRKDKEGNFIVDENGNFVPNKYFGKELRVSYPDGDFIYNITDFNSKRYGFSTATKVKDTRKAVSYIVKYITKELVECTQGKRRYFPSRNLLYPERYIYCSERSSLDDIVKYVEDEFGVKLQMDFMKVKKIQHYDYSNTVSYLEFY